MRFTSDTDWTMVTSSDCYRCTSTAYNHTASSTYSKGTDSIEENLLGDLRYAGISVKD